MRYVLLPLLHDGTLLLPFAPKRKTLPPKSITDYETTRMTEIVLPTVEILSKPDCHLCHEAKVLLQELQASHPFSLREVDITTRTDLLELYREEIPVVFINGRKAFKYRVDPKQFSRALRRARPRRWHLSWTRES